MQYIPAIHLSDDTAILLHESWYLENMSMSQFKLYCESQSSDIFMVCSSIVVKLLLPLRTPLEDPQPWSPSLLDLPSRKQPEPEFKGWVSNCKHANQCIKMNLDALLLILQHIANICERELVNTVLLAPAQNRGLWLKPHLVYRERSENGQEEKCKNKLRWLLDYLTQKLV